MTLSSDQVLRRAVDEFVANDRPSNTDLAQFGALFCGHFSRASSTTRMLCADALAKCDVLTDDVIDAVALDNSAIGARFIRISPALSCEKLAELADRMNIDQLRALARRPHLPKPVARQLRALSDAQIDRAIDLRQVIEPKPVAFHGGGKMAKGEYVEILHAAKARDLTTLCLLLSQRLSITQQSAFLLLSDKRSSNLIIALKFVGLAADDAWSIFHLLAPAIAHDDQIRANFTATFEQYSERQCAETVQNWIIDDLASEMLKPISGNDDASPIDPIDQAVDMLKAS